MIETVLCILGIHVISAVAGLAVGYACGAILGTDAGERSMRGQETRGQWPKTQQPEPLRNASPPKEQQLREQQLRELWNFMNYAGEPMPAAEKETE